MTKFRKVRKDDFRYLDVQIVDREALEHVISCDLDVDDFVDPDYSWTATKDGDVIAIGGVSADGWSWLFLHKTLRRGEMIPIVRHSARVIWGFMSERQADVYAHIDLTKPNRVRLAKLLGFWHLHDCYDHPDDEFPVGEVWTIAYSNTC